MSRISLSPLGAAAALCLLLAACSSNAPVLPSQIASAPDMAANTEGDTARQPFRTAAMPDWRDYSGLIIDPVVIYRGTDAQFDDMSENDQAELAQYMQRRFAATLGQRFTLRDRPAPGTLRLRLTLTGATGNTPFLAPVTRIDLSGGLYNLVQTTRGHEGSFSGDVTYAVEIFDASSGQLLGAWVTRQYPTPFNISATFGRLAAAKTGIDKGSDALLDAARQPGKS
jgi:hypothetical protein